MKRAMVTGMLAALVVVAVLATVAFVVRDRFASDTDLSRVVVVLEASDGTGTAEAQVVLGIDVAAEPVSVAAWDPLATATVPGTTGSTLRDAYAFGGGGGLSSALAGQRFQPQAWVSVPVDVWTAAVDAAGGATVTVPVATDAFTGSQLFSFEKGERRMTGDECAAYMTALDAQEDPVDARVGREALTRGVVIAFGSRPSLDGLLLAPGNGSNVRARDLETYVERLSSGLGQADLRFYR